MAHAPLRLLTALLALAVLIAGCTSDAPINEPVDAATTDPTPEATDTDPPAGGGEPVDPPPSNTTPKNTTRHNATTPTNTTVPPATTPPPERPPGVVIAIIDSGIRADHLSFTTGQLVGWYDFTDKTPRDLLMWDPRVVTPVDAHGHGTAVASMAAGRPIAELTPSHAPGTKIAMARVLGADGIASGDIAQAFRWATEVVRADVITMSIGSVAPVSPVTPEVYAAMEAARAAGILVLVSAGNGGSVAGVSGIPTTSWINNFGATNAALVVGGAWSDGLPVAPLGASMDPEVVALYEVKAACAQEKGCYAQWYGTSFSTPLVAGMAAKLIETARAVGTTLTPAQLESILKRAALDSPDIPPALEGYGLLDADALGRAIRHVRDGAELPTPDVVTETYVETLGSAERDTWGRIRV